MILDLPSHLCQRTRLVSGRHEECSSEFVLYWMHTAVRAHENPALDVARIVAAQRGQPLLVYHALSEDYRYASDRHHTFIIDGARDVQEALSQAGVSYAFHLADRIDRRSHLVDLARSASVVITDDMPVDPVRRYLKVLTRRVRSPVYCVDTACVVPMQSTGKAYTRAFQFRDETAALRSQRIAEPWPELDTKAAQLDLSRLPFAPVDLAEYGTSELVAACGIDHSVGPVVDTLGGSAAGYRRWEAFKENGLRKYAQTRNNALVSGVSRMSAYLHYGMVSPMRLAREAERIGGPGATKYLDELLIWRELAYHFCFYRADHDTWSAIPTWAQETLRSHAADRRDEVYSWEQLARGKTGDQLWNAAQKSLLMHGELHNNVRMTWGKAILNWQETPEKALAMLIDLNHRYALDGRDPASYGGLLWCLGQFDRPFTPEQPIIGTVRGRSTEAHAKRLDPVKYMHHVSQPRFAATSVAVVGAGMSGLIAARILRDHGLDVTVFEKSRGAGGRMATRRVEGETQFDHGAQYFTARDPRFRRYVDSWEQQGVVARWPTHEASDQRIVVLRDGRVASESMSQARYVGVPSMNAICKQLASDLDVKAKCEISKVQPCNDAVELLDANGQSVGRFDQLVVSAPAPQTRKLLGEFPVFDSALSKVSMSACWAAMYRFDKLLTSKWSGAFLHDSFLSWAARNGTKPGRDAGNEYLVVHATRDWTQEHLERDAVEVASLMLEEFWRVSGAKEQVPSHRSAHRWRFAIATGESSMVADGCLFDKKHRIVACGDWAHGSRVEGAFLSGSAAAGRLLGTLVEAPTEPATQLSLF
ncbi:MAG: NAD(P)-binding protein [Aureliella sp.]